MLSVPQASLGDFWTVKRTVLWVSKLYISVIGTNFQFFSLTLVSFIFMNFSCNMYGPLNDRVLPEVRYWIVLIMSLRECERDLYECINCYSVILFCSSVFGYTVCYQRCNYPEIPLQCPLFHLLQEYKEDYKAKSKIGRYLKLNRGCGVWKH